MSKSKLYKIKIAFYYFQVQLNLSNTKLVYSTGNNLHPES